MFFSSLCIFAGKLLSFEEMGPTMIRRLILLRRSQAPPGVDFYDMLFTIFRFCPFAPLVCCVQLFFNISRFHSFFFIGKFQVEAVELILHIDMSEQQFENVALKYSFCFHCVSPEHNHTRPCTMCVQRRQSIFRSAKIEHVISSFVEWMMQRNRAASTFLRTDSTMWVFRQARLRFLPECSLLRSIDQLCNAPTVVEMRATNNSVALQAARPSQMASDSDSQLTSTSTTAATSIHSSTRTTPPKDSTASTSVSATPSTELKWQRETQPVNLAQQGAFDENQVQGQPQPQPQPQLQQHQNHDQNAFHWAVLQRLQVVASAQSTDVVCTQCDKKCTYPRTKAQAGDDVCVCSDAGFESMLADSDVAAVTADVATASNHQLTAFAAPTEPITDLPQWAAIMQSQIETLQKARAEDTAKFEKLKSEHTELKSDHTELKSEHTELKSEHTKLKSEHTAQLAPLLCTDFVVKLADLLQSVLHHSLKQNAQVNVASHSSVLQLQYSEKLKKLPVDDQILCNYLRVISRPRNSLAHPCELSSQNAEYQVVVSPKAKPLGQFLSWSTMIYQLRGAMHDDQLNKLFAELNRDDDTSLNRDNQPVSLQVSVLKSRPGSEIVCDALLLVREFVDNPKSNFPIQSEPMSAEDLDFIRSFSGQAASSSSK
jgi:hypothetical protein